MKVLIVKKATTQELQEDQIQALPPCFRDSSELIHAIQASHDEHHDTLTRLREELVRRSIGFDELSRKLPWPTGAAYDAVISVGGDGTVLAASHEIEDKILLIGIRSSSASVGCLCASDRDGLSHLVDQLADGAVAFSVVNRLVAVVTAACDGEPRPTKPALNDFLFAHANPAITTRYRLTVSARTERQKSSGIWFSTAVGSTGAILAAGGKRLPLGSPAFQYRIRELFHPQQGEAQTLRGGEFDPDLNPVSFENECETAILSLDGRYGPMQLGLGDRVSFRRGPTLRLAQPRRG